MITNPAIVNIVKNAVFMVYEGKWEGSAEDLLLEAYKYAMQKSTGATNGTVRVGTITTVHEPPTVPPPSDPPRNPVTKRNRRRSPLNTERIIDGVNHVRIAAAAEFLEVHASNLTRYMRKYGYPITNLGRNSVWVEERHLFVFGEIIKQAKETIDMDKHPKLFWREVDRLCIPYKPADKPTLRKKPDPRKKLASRKAIQ